MDIELKIGQEFVADGFRIMAVEGSGCSKCFFNHNESCEMENNLVCSGENRKDMKDVIFVESNLPEVSNLIAPPDTRSYNVGASDYSKHTIQPWDIWNEYRLNPYDADIVKRVLRRKAGEDRVTDYRKIVHVCQERIRQLEAGADPFGQDDK